ATCLSLLLPRGTNAVAHQACGRGGCWERAVRLVDDMHAEGLVPDSLTYRRVIGARCGLVAVNDGALVPVSREGGLVPAHRERL
ncbi:unnamed protein product, partial [Ectocarpus sp. 13 AM-2016]